MAERYDAVVIGAGLGGLSAAAALARKGLSVLVLERHVVPGGYATSFARGRYEFEVSLHVLSDIGSPERPGGLQKFLRDVGAWDDVEFIRVRHFSRSLFPDHDVVLPMDPAGFEDAACRAFPGSAPGVRRFMKRVMAVAQEADGLSDAFARSPGGRFVRLATLPLRLRAMPRYAFTSLEAVLDRDVDDPRARALLCQGWSYVGMPPSECSFLFYAAMMGSLLNHGGWYPKTRSQGLSSALARALQRHGGHLRLGTGARRITVRNGRVAGVVDEEGTEFEARAVVSNAGPIATYRDLIGREHLPDGTLERLRRYTVGTSIFQVYLGVAKPAAELGIESHEVMMNESYDVEAHYRRGSTFERPGHMLIGCPNLAVPEISPAGTALVTLTAMVYGKPWLTIPPEEYVDRKTQFAERMLAWAETVTPGLRDAVEVVEVGTPVTMARYAGHPGGAIYGFENRPNSHTVLRPPPVGPIPGLYHVGAWTNPGGGYWPAISSGQIVGEIASVILRRGAP